MSSMLLLQLTVEVERMGGSSHQLPENCYLVVVRHSGWRGVACVGRNTVPPEEITPQFRRLAHALWPEGAPQELLEGGGGIRLIRALAVRLHEIMNDGSVSQHPFTRGQRAEALCF
ncbi:MAG: hypothetical protein KDD44_08410 [Bdellovibrionales bacterium]|nr:hypothetical protein [Bdellovibrionales bacterium]